MKLSIPNPCPENWNKMTPSENGRHCSSCEKVVVDFTKMNDEEIGAYFLASSHQKTCGSFYSHQLENKKTGAAQIVVLNWYNKSEQKIKSRFIRVVAIFAFGVLLTIMGCRPKRYGGAPTYSSGKYHHKTATETIVVGDVNSPAEPPQVDTLKTPR